MDEREDIDAAAATNGASGDGGSIAPVLAGSEARVIERAQPAALATPVVAAAGGALVGALAVFLLGLFRRSERRELTTVRIGKRRGRRGALEVAGSRSFLVDVHMLKR